MKAEMDKELRKVELATTLCHLCSLTQLEKWAAKARKQAKGQPRLPEE